MREPDLRVRQYVPAPYFFVNGCFGRRLPCFFMRKLYDVVIIRSFAIIMVVFFHAYGMMYWGHFPNSQDVYEGLYYGINQYVLNFRMPLFIFISGYLFSYLERERGKYPTLRSLVNNKFQRLIIPYFVFATLYMLSNHCFDVKELLLGGCAHLWFITMLFWCFVIVRLVSKILHNDRLSTNLIVLALSFILSFHDLNISIIMGLSSSLRWLFWFYLGYVLSPYRDSLYAFMDKRRYIPVACFSIYIIELLYTFGNVETADARSPYLMRVAHLAIVLFIWYFVNWLIRQHPGKWMENRVFKELNKTSYGIYVLHYWLQPFIISTTAKRLESVWILFRV